MTPPAGPPAAAPPPGSAGTGQPPRGSARTALLTTAAVLAFAANSLLCRVALQRTSIDAPSFTTLRLVAGAVVLALLVGLRRTAPGRRGGDAGSGGSWASAAALFAYAAAFSQAYVSLPAGTGALLLFGAVQATMIGRGLARGERLGGLQWLGLAVALAGLVTLLWPGLAAPPPAGAALMLGAGVAWGVYSLRGAGAADPLRATAGNFVRAVPLTLVLSVLTIDRLALDAAGVACAVASGALASGLGYAVWYTALRGLRATSAATVQLGVPVLAALGGVAWLGEPPSARLGIAALAVLGGVAVVLRFRAPRAGAR